MKDFLERILGLDSRIRMVVSSIGPISDIEKVSRKDLNSIDVEDDWSFLKVNVASMIGLMEPYEDTFGKIVMTGAFYEKLFFVFFRHGEGIILVSFEPCPIHEISDKIVVFLDSIQ